MKPKNLIWLMLLITTNLIAQSSDIKFVKSVKSVGKNLITNQQIQATEFVFPKRIHSVYFDTITGYANLCLRKLSKNGKVLDLYGTTVIFELNTDQVKWS